MIYSDSVPDYDVSHQLRLLFLHRLSCYFTLSPPLNDALLYLREENYKESVHVSYKDDYKESVILLIPNSHDSIFIAFQFIYPEITLTFLEKCRCFYLKITLKLCFTNRRYLVNNDEHRSPIFNHSHFPF